MANRGKNNKGNKGKGNNTSAAPAKTTGITISEEDAAILEKVKQIAKDAEVDLTDYKKLLEDELEEEIGRKREEQERSLESAKTKMEEEYKKELDEKYKALKKETSDLEKTKQELDSTVSGLQGKLDKISEKISGAEEEARGIIKKAEEDAQGIIDQAREDAKTASQEVLDEIAGKRTELEDQMDDFETKQFELEAREAQLASKEKRVAKQAEVYDTANPDMVESLKRQLSITREQLDAVRDEYEQVQIELNKMKLKQIRAEGISAEDLQEENERLMEKVEELENKCNRYSDYELLEMKRALDAEKDYLIRIQNQDREIAESRAELGRLQNGQMEYEQLRAQLDLLRTLNDHLRGELDNTKKMLESSVGEICPALTAIDIQQTEVTGEEYNRVQQRADLKVDMRSMNLPKLVTHVKTYAASRAKPLFYSDRDLRAYIAGMASSHLSILQGMSGTGKTSLPKIFAEAVMGEINVVVVESSWRDRNELLGYYNDFSKKFTAKEFTCDLYRAGCDRYKDTIYIIVLDEMNLSRVEYYFADFLSVLEHEANKWKIKLVDTDLRQLPTEITPAVREALEKEKGKEAAELKAILDKLYPEDTFVLDEDEETKVTANDKLRLIAYMSGKKFKNAANTRYLVGGPQNLIDGNTVRIPSNVWFVGTANRDESTFEITDKVYDRAQVLEFNKRAKGKQLSEVEKIYLPYEALEKMFLKAAVEYEFDGESYALLAEIEQILQANFKISYGNRILDQINKFVPVYVAAGQGSGLSNDELIREAIDYQLTYKVLRKLEYVEMNRDANKDAGDKLRKKFEQSGMKLAKEFMDWKLRGDFFFFFLTYVNNKNQKQKLSGETTAYVLPFSGLIVVTEIVSPFAYVNGDAIKVENGKIAVPIQDKAIELEADDVHFNVCVLCTPWTPTMLLDYNSFGRTYANNLIDEGIDQEILFSAIEDEDAEELHISLCTFSRSYESITSREFDIDKALEYTQRIPHVFYKPKQHLKQVNEIRPAAVASRTGQESIRYLASHSEHWKGIKANGLIPERLLARVLEDDFAIYENKAAKTLVDEFLRIASRLRLETMDCQLQINMDDSHSVSSEQKIYFKAKDALLKGLDDEDLYIQQEILAEQTEKLSEIINLLSDCKSTQLYRSLRKTSPIRGKLKQTNIFMKDKYYKYIYKLWNLLEGASKVGIEEIAKPIESEYDVFCRVLLLFALRYYNFAAENEQQDVLQNGRFVESAYRFENWNANVYEDADQGFVLEMSKYNEIEVDLTSFEISDNLLNSIVAGVSFKNGILSADHALSDKEQEQLVSAAKVCWPKNRQKTFASDMKQRLYAAFFNYSTTSHKILFVPWKYCMPGNVEQIKETIKAIRKEIKINEYDECFILTISRPNEITGVDDATVMQSLLFYGDANEDKGMSQDKIGIIPISLSDINSYRRYTKIILRHMVALDDSRNVCPICGQKLYQSGNSYECRNQYCQFELIDTKCPECKKKYYFSRYPLSKLAETKRVESIGFNML